MAKVRKRKKKNSDGQGITISLVVFVVLFGMTGVLAYHYFNKADTLSQQEAQSRKNATKLAGELAEREAEFRALRELAIGLGDKPKPAPVEQPQPEPAQTPPADGEPMPPADGQPPAEPAEAPANAPADGEAPAAPPAEETPEEEPAEEPEVAETDDSSDAKQMTPEEILGRIEDTLNKPILADSRKARQKEYLSLVTAVNFLQSELAEADRRILRLQRQNTDIEGIVSERQSRYQTGVDEAESFRTAGLQDFDQKLAPLEALKKSRQESLDLAKKAAGDWNTKLEQYNRNKRNEVKKYEQEIMTKNAQILNEQREVSQLDQLKFEMPDGQIVDLIEQGDKGRFALINLGTADGIKPGLLFSVFDTAKGGNYFELPRGNIEIVRTLGSHISQARMSSFDIKNPILIGDVIYNPIWSTEHKEGVAVLGSIYMDRDKKPDDELFKRLVEAHGGKIVATVDPNTGKIIGNIDTNTGWLVMGHIPEPSESLGDKEAALHYKELNKAKPTVVAEARKNGVRIIDYRNFLTYLGYDESRNRVGPGQEYDFMFGKSREMLAPNEVETPARPEETKDDEESSSSSKADM